VTAVTLVFQACSTGSNSVFQCRQEQPVVFLLLHGPIVVLCVQWGSLQLWTAVMIPG